MKVKLLKKIRKRYKIIKNDHSGIEALDHKLKRVPKWLSLTVFMRHVAIEYFGISTAINWEERRIRRENRTQYLRLKSIKPQ